MICGLAHHSIPYTVMKEEDEKESTSRNKPLITPAPQFNTLETQQSFHHRDFDKLPISRKPLSLQRIKHFLLTMATRCDYDRAGVKDREPSQDLVAFLDRILLTDEDKDEGLSLDDFNKQSVLQKNTYHNRKQWLFYFE
ncbi:hypothetical protein CU098_009775 [Rhizopus stolonifer]|uniref:Uncharacterized protein n=1 Tax=Rhizopus stolonifer TaxID=4846 RepID=A0A367JF70_RHIST|nr:hypothetical protein CU098_009775 [Rhizopus stolonifer]